jgi:hypothetical protein
MRQATHFPAVAFFVTVGGVGFKKAFATMEALAGRKPATALILRTEDFKRGRDQVAISSFAAAVGGRSKAA